jgi:flavorubredoxin
VAEPVGVDDVIDLGGRTLRFLPAMMVHWPDSMFTYCPEERVLMPNDAFGQHLATSGRFADEVGMDVAIHELGVYFANILLPLTAQVTKTLGRMAEVGWEPEIVAPSHGVIWRGADQIEAASEAYAGWLAQETCEKLLVVYSTMWGSTELAARAIAEGAAEEGVTTKLYDLACTAYSTILFELLDARTIALGSPTLHHTMLYRVGGFLTYLEGLKPEGRLAATFGSYGWGGGAIKAMRPWLERIGFTLYDADFGIKFKPADEELAAAREWGRALARATKEHPGAPTVGR